MKKPKNGTGVSRKTRSVEVAAEYTDGLVWVRITRGAFSYNRFPGMTIGEANALASCILLLTGGKFKTTNP